MGGFVTPETDTIDPNIERVEPTVTSLEPDTATWDPTITLPTPTVTVMCEDGVEHEELSSLSHEFSLFQNYPNPFNSMTQVKYALLEDCHVRLEIYNILGQKVASLVDGRQTAGYKSVRWDASTMSSGIYFYRLQVRRTPHSYGAGDYTETRRMVLLK